MNSKDVENIFEKISKTKNKDEERFYISELQKICDEIYNKYAKLTAKYNDSFIILPEFKVFTIENLKYKVLNVSDDTIFRKFNNEKIEVLNKGCLIDLIDGYGYAENDIKTRRETYLKMMKGKYIAEISDLNIQIKELENKLESIDIELNVLNSEI